MDLEGSMVHYLNFRVNKRQRSCLDFAIIKFVNSKTVPSLSREAVYITASPSAVK